MGKAKDKFNKQLSKSYRFKKKIGKVKKRTDVNPEKHDIKKAKIIIRNLPFQATESDIAKLYEPFGKITEIHLLKRPDGKPVGCGFVQFENVQEASKAIFKTNKSNFLGRTISSEWAIPKSQFIEKLQKEKEEVKDEVKEEVNETVSTEDQSNEVSEIKINEKRKKKNSLKKNPLSKAEQRKLYKLKKRQKRSRIVIRNLPFTVTEDALKEHFHKYGNIEEIKILRKGDNTPTGCCFLQFDRVQSAAQAIHHENMKPLLNRPMVVDWAIAKDKFQKNQNPDVKKEGDEDEITVVKEEINENFNSREIKVKEEKESDDEIKEEDRSEQSDESSDNGENNQDEGNSDDSEDEDDKTNIKLELDKQSVASSMTSRRISNDVHEGKTVFIKNVPFSVKNEELRECMLQFGPVYYALVCMDSLTEHSKGTAFVKFTNQEDAEKCLAAGTELTLHGQVLDPHRALHKNDVNKKNAEKNQKIKDSRNLYLVKEGVILASTPAAQDVSASDMAKRLQLEQWKSQMLRNLNMFVSRVRLAVQNLPETCDDSKLRQLFKKHSNSNAVITEARVMRDLKNIGPDGIGKSKGYGFVSFSKHEDALHALRSINNNPNIFTPAKRPIVAFSIENRVMVNAKQKRLERSRQHNPLWKSNNQRSEEAGHKDKARTSANNNEEAGPSRKRFKRENKPAQADRKLMESKTEVEEFAGATSKPGVTKLNGKFFLKKQAAQHVQNLKQQRKDKRNSKRMIVQKIEQNAKRKDPKPKQGSRAPDADEVHFNKLVNSYKNKLSAVSRSKWYEAEER